MNEAIISIDIINIGLTLLGVVIIVGYLKLSFQDFKSEIKDIRFYQDKILSGNQILKDNINNYISNLKESISQNLNQILMLNNLILSIQKSLNDNYIKSSKREDKTIEILNNVLSIIEGNTKLYNSSIEATQDLGLKMLKLVETIESLNKALALKNEVKE